MAPLEQFDPAQRALLAGLKIPIHLSALDEHEWPRLVSLWFLEREGELWCATRNDARIVEFLRTQPRCSFEVSTQDIPYRGIRGRAIAHIDPDRGVDVLGDLIDRYLGSRDSAFARWLLSRAADEVAIRIEPISASSWDFSERMATE